ncbi:MAG TPA: hypothetical protein VMU05_15480, partial [Dongiaceae bacterium]|nr:hypothetical protein [Dongiaceae bacterium]
EVLAEREFDIGRFYYLRESFGASIARLQSLVDKYPLYSRADEAYYLLGQNYEGQIQRIHKSPTCDVHMLPRNCMQEAAKARAISELSKKAAAEYSTIVTRYPLMDRSDDAKKRLEALHEPVPRPTKAAVARNKAEIESRGERTMFGQMKSLIKKGPDVSTAAHYGEPTLVEPEPISATEIQKQEASAFLGSAAPSGNKLGVEIVKPNQPAGGDVPPAADANATPFGTSAAGNAALPSPATPDPNELEPNQPADPNELKPTDSGGGDASLPPPTQVNEIGQSSSSATAKADDSTPATDQDISSSKKKKKSGLKKINPF